MKSLFLLMMFFVTSSFSYFEIVNLKSQKFNMNGIQCFYSNYNNTISFSVFVYSPRTCPYTLKYDAHTGQVGE